MLVYLSNASYSRTLTQICFINFNESPLKMMESAFFHRKSSFRSQDF